MIPIWTACRFFPDVGDVTAVSDEAGLQALLSDARIHLVVIVLPVQVALQVWPCYPARRPGGMCEGPIAVHVPGDAVDCSLHAVTYTTAAMEKGLCAQMSVPFKHLSITHAHKQA